MRASQRDAALAAATIAFELQDWFESKFSLPETKLVDLQGIGPEAAAEMLRVDWGLGQNPIENTIHLLESRGVRIFSLAEDTTDVDAFSMWRGNNPFIFLNTRKSAERSRFDAAHELGHLVLHRHGGPLGRQAEHEANVFASAFLMPQASVLAHAPRLVSIPSIIHAKRYWGVSAHALVVRLFKIGLVTEWTYRSLCVQINKLGYHRIEPQSRARENSQVLDKVFALLRNRKLATRDIAHQFGLMPEDLHALVFGLVLTPTTGGGGSRSHIRQSKASLTLLP